MMLGAAFPFVFEAFLHDLVVVHAIELYRQVYSGGAFGNRREC
jgi:hypothetical protein